MNNQTEITTLCFIDFTNNKNSTRPLRIDEIIEIVISVFDFQRQQKIFHKFQLVKPSIYLTIFNIDQQEIIWDDVELAETLEKILYQYQKEINVPSKELIVIFENNEKLEAFYKETEIKSIQLKWEYFCIFEQLILDNKISNFLGRNEQFDIVNYLKLSRKQSTISAKTPTIVVDEMLKYFNQQNCDNLKCTPIKRGSIYSNESLMNFSNEEQNISIIIKKKNLLQNESPKVPFTFQHSQTQKTYKVSQTQEIYEKKDYQFKKVNEKILKEPYKQEQIYKKIDHSNDFDFILIIDINTPYFNAKGQLLFQLPGVIYDVQKGQTLKNRSFFKFIREFDQPPEKFHQYYCLKNFEKHGVSFKQAYFELKEFLRDFKGKIAIMVYSTRQYQRTFIEELKLNQLQNEVGEEFKNPFALAIEWNNFKSNGKKYTFDDIINEFSLTQRKDAYECLQNSWLIGDIMERMQNKGYRWKEMNRTSLYSEVNLYSKSR